MFKPLVLLGMLVTSPAVFADESAQETADTPVLGPVYVGPGLPVRPLCEGDGCDAYLSDPIYSESYRDRLAERRVGAVLGGVSGALIGEEIGGAPAAIGLGALGAALGYRDAGSRRWEEDAKRFDAAWQRGDDIYYNPAHPIPYTHHYWGKSDR